MHPTESSPRSVSSAEVIQTILQLITARELAQSAALLQAVAPMAQQDPRFHTLQMMQAEACGQPDQALEAARTAVRLAPHWGPAQLDLALLLGRLGRCEEALAQARKALGMVQVGLPELQQLIDLAHQAQDRAQAAQWLQQALRIEPGHRLHQQLLAADLSALGQHAQATALFDQLLLGDPDDEEALLGRAHALLHAGQRAAALRDWSALLARQPDNPAWQYYHALAQGQTPSTQPSALVGSLFDHMATSFDQHLVQRLHYQLPQQLARQLLQWHPDRRLHLLDLGCGTGLLGAALGPIDGDLGGVDVSAGMLALAARHGVYQQLQQGNLLELLAAMAPGRYQVVAALDVFIYVGALQQVVPACARLLAPGGRLVFSCESAEPHEADLVLRSSGRYAHQQQQVLALCRASGLQQIEVQPVALRLEAGRPLPGFLLVAQRPG